MSSLEVTILKVVWGFIVVFSMFVLAVAGSVIYTDLTYSWPRGLKRNPLFHYANRHKRRKK